MFDPRPCGIERRWHFLRVLAAGLRHVGPAAAAPADNFGGAFDPFAGVEPLLLQLAADAGHERDLIFLAAAKKHRYGAGGFS